MAKRKHSEISAILQILFFHPVNMHDLSTDCRRGPDFTSNRRLVCVGAHRQEFVGKHSRCDGLCMRVHAAAGIRRRTLQVRWTLCAAACRACAPRQESRCVRDAPPVYGSLPGDSKTFVKRIRLSCLNAPQVLSYLYVMF